MRAALLSLVLLALASCRCAAPAADGDAIMAVLHAQVEAWNRGEIEGYMSAGYWHSPELTFFSGGSVTKGYDAVLARYKKRYQSEGTEMGHLEFAQIEIQPLGPESALARGRWSLAFEHKAPLSGLFSLVLRRLPEGWRAVHDHTSIDTP